jgi:SsrA-binding protein
VQANRFNHHPKRSRKLLLKSREISRLAKGLEREGMTIVPLKIYFNERGRAKIELALGRGKKLHDKRQSEKQRDWNREKGRLLRDRG